MASLQLFSQLLNERKKCALSPSKPQLLALLGFPLGNVPPKGPGVGGRLLVVLEDLVAAAGLCGGAHHPSPSSGCPSPEFSSCSSSFLAPWRPCSWWSMAVTSSARHQPDVTAHDPGQAVLEVHPRRSFISLVGGEHRSPPELADHL